MINFKIERYLLDRWVAQSHPSNFKTALREAWLRKVKGEQVRILLNGKVIWNDGVMTYEAR